ncbi:YbcC family protein [Marinobacter sp. C2H3]|uniref:YbcC family protein n=1 Tax=Marinobacter sp. C2H3 TaxID=3119003 RepID=UPI00300F4A56
MTAPLAIHLPGQQRALLAQTCERLAPVWPLDRWIAVNPWWGLRQMDAPAAEALLRRNLGHHLLMPAEFYRDAWKRERITRAHLDQALAEAGDSGLTHQEVLERLNEPEPQGCQVVSALKCLPDPAFEESAINRAYDQVGRLCASYFDVRQSRWPVTEGPRLGLFSFWREQSGMDPMLGATTGLSGLSQWVRNLPEPWEEAADRILETLNLSDGHLTALGHRHLGGLIGWASWCRGEDWRAALEGQPSDLGAQLLTILLAFEAYARIQLSVEGRTRLQKAWQRYEQRQEAPADDRLWVWQRAYELGWQEALGKRLKAVAEQPAAQDTPPAVQAVFCIDVRSEVFRRHLEDGRPGVQTLGFAGFFGMPIAHLRPGAMDDEPRLPGLLAPAYRFNESTGSRAGDVELNRELDQREMNRESIRRAKYTSLSAFTLVETTGLAWAWKLVRDSLNRNPERKPPESYPEARLVHRHGGDPLSDAERVDLAENLLRGMSLTKNFASLLVLVGHGSHTDNNPNEAGLACGACGGKNGGINARAAASLLNDRLVRAGLAERDIRIPDFCHAVAAEHCTVTDRVRILNRESVPDTHLLRLEELEQALTDAGRATRRERAEALGLTDMDDDGLMDATRLRTVNWAEVRPEWGLANNAALILAKRSRSRGADLGGRCFLHDYDPELDPEGAILTALMSAPMVVANWINLQYFASVTSPTVYGAGNKLLHSVVGGQIGVIEGNGTDLRIGLPIQSVHDGENWRHEPVRLTVVIDAPEERIRKVMSQQVDVAALINHQWLWVYRLAPDGKLLPVRPQ